LDFEATCDDSQRIKPQEVIEFPIVLVDAQTLTSVDEFRTYVRPVHHPRLTAFCTELTGIRQSEVDGAPIWAEALQQACAWLDERLLERGCAPERCLFVSCGDWDLKSMIVEQCVVSGEHVPERFRRWLNIKNLFKRTLGTPAGGMEMMLEAVHLPLEGRHHSGLDDSRNIAKLLADLLRRGGPAAVEEGLLSFADKGGGGKKGGGKAGKNSAKGAGKRA
jgi:inhibitor of KinA sporulation pathway (predicted exonuclease)